MKNIYSILLDELEKGIPVAIATIIGTKGSTPQVQGASAIFSKKGIIAFIDCYTNSLVSTGAKFFVLSVIPQII